jgi:selenocysteine lyase/cysteine desulfurase
VEVADAQRLFSPEGTYLNTASYGLPPRPAWEAVHSAQDEWPHGRTGFDGWDESVGRSRAAWARLHGVDVADVAIGPQVSPFVGIVAASLQPGSRVLAAREEFTSLLFPLLAQQARGVQVRTVPLDELAEAVDGGTDLVAVSAVQSRDGRLADLDAIAAAARHHGARTLVDATQACGWLPIDAGRFDVLVCAAYKWLCAPRGTALMTVRPEVAERLTPQAAGWYAGADPHSSYYGPPLRLAGDARRFDVSPAWFSWVAAAPALELLNEIGIERIHEHDLRLANLFREGLGLAPGQSAIVSAELPGAEERLRDSPVMAAARAGMLRTSWHLYNGEDDVRRVLELLSAEAEPRPARGSGAA